MGYQKIVQYGDTTEIYQYERELHRKHTPSTLKAVRLAYGGSNNRRIPLVGGDVKKKRKDKAREEAKRRGFYTRSKASIRRCRTNFFRLCHHNVVFSNSVHFVTFTFPEHYEISYTTASRHVRRFMEDIRSIKPEISIRYISVPELTKKGQYHFHVLVFDLPSEVSGSPISIRRYNRSKKRWEVVGATTERFTRNLQRRFQRGFIDIVPATYTSGGIAGYMAKYMAKSLEDTRYQTTRGYNCSRNIKKVSSQGSNTLSTFNDLLIHTESLDGFEQKQYDVPYLGSCRFTKIVKK